MSKDGGFIRLGFIINQPGLHVDVYSLLCMFPDSQMQDCVSISYGQGRKLQCLLAWQHIEKLVINGLVQEVPTCGHTGSTWAVFSSQKENVM